MAFNMRFTEGETSGKPLIKRSFKYVLDEHHNVLCGISNKCICDLNGNEIATFSRSEKIVSGAPKQKVYESKFGQFIYFNNALFLGGNKVGYVSKSVHSILVRRNGEIIAFQV